MQISSEEFSSQPASTDELISFIARSAKEHFDRTRRCINGSVLAVLIKEQYPTLDYAKLGLSKLGDAVRLGEARQLIRRNMEVKHLEICPVDAEGATPPRLTNPELLYVRPELWRASVLTSAGTSRGFNRKSGELVPLVSEGPPNPDVVQISIVSETQQLEWLKEFLASKGLSANDSEGHSLPNLLHGGIRDFGPAIVTDWRGFRSRRAVDHIRFWAAKHKIPESMVLTPASREAKKERVHEQTVSQTQSSDENAVKGAILAALGELPLSDLEEIWLPMRAVLRHFKPN